jgi:hypothetical protein
MSAVLPTTGLSFKLSRDFFFSTVLNNLTQMSQGLLSDVENQSLARLVKQFKALLGNDDALTSVLSGSAVEISRNLNEITNHDAIGNNFFYAAVRDTVSPSPDLLVRNRFIVLLRDKIEGLSDPLLKQSLSIASMYFGEDTIRPETISAAADNALGSISARFEMQSVPEKDTVTGILFGVLDEAIREHQVDPETRVIHDEYTPERLSGLKVNM